MIRFTVILAAVSWIACNGQRDPANSFKPILTLSYRDQIDPLSRADRLAHRAMSAAWRIKRRMQRTSGVD